MSRPVLVATLALAGCGTAGRYPSRSAQRPLSMPAGEHQLVASAGPRLGPATGELAEPDASWTLAWNLGYRYGVTDRLDIHFPLGVGLLVHRGEKGEVALGAGAVGIGWQQAWLRPYRGDPRQPNERVSSWTAAGEASVALRRVWCDQAATLARIGFGQRLFGGRLDDRWVRGNLALVLDASDKVSVALALGAAWYRDWDQAQSRRIIAIGGAGSDGYAPVPTVALHVREHVDLTVSVGVVRDLSQKRNTYTGMGGLDLHID